MSFHDWRRPLKFSLTNHASVYKLNCFYFHSYRAKLARNYKKLPFEISKIVKDMKGKSELNYKLNGFYFPSMKIHDRAHFSLVYFIGLKYILAAKFSILARKTRHNARQSDNNVE